MLDFKFYDDNMRLKNIFMFSMAIGTLSLQSYYKKVKCGKI